MCYNNYILALLGGNVISFSNLFKRGRVSANSCILVTNIPKTVKAISLSSFFINISTLMVFSFFGVYLHHTLNVNLTKIGILDGAVEACAFIMKLFSGYLSDILCNRKMLFLLGAILLFLAKPLEAIGRSFGPLFCAKIIERFGNGLQSTPRDALVGDWAPEHSRARCFGLRQSFAAMGCLSGTIIATLLFHLLNDYQAVFWCACIPAFIAVLIITFAVKNKYIPNKVLTHKHLCKINVKTFAQFPKRFWVFLVIAAIYNCAKVSESLVILHTTSTYDLGMFMAPLVLSVCYVSNSLSAVISGSISDRTSKTNKIFMFGLASFIFADLLFIFDNGKPILALGALLCLGIYNGISQSIFASKISEISPPNLKGTGLGIYNLVCALSLLFGGTIIGRVADLKGFTSAFSLSAILATTAFSILFVLNRRRLLN